MSRRLEGKPDAYLHGDAVGAMRNVAIEIEAGRPDDARRLLRAAIREHEAEINRRADAAIASCRGRKGSNLKDL